MADLVFNFKIEQMAEIFDQDNDLKLVLIDNYFYTPDVSVMISNPLRINQYKQLAELLLEEYDYISNMEIDNLWALSFRVPEMERIFDKPFPLTELIFKQIIYSFKFGSVKHFFKDNYYKFLPSMDAAAIDTTEKMKLFQEAFMKEYDRFADIIDEMKNITDVDTIGNDYLGYLVQLLGYEKGDDSLLGKDSFRELAKNMIEVYRIKGTNYSFELFFNFLGFEVILDEFWFDKRYGNEGYSINPYTGSKQPHTFEYYLTPIKPTECIPKEMTEKKIVMDNEITEIRSHLWFEKKIQQGYSVDQLLGNDPDLPPEEGFDYSYFKTNIIQYSIKRIRSKETDQDELSADDEKVIQQYSDFLTPIFIHKRIQISISPFEDNGENLGFSDASIYNSNLRTYDNLFKIKGDLHLYDKWVDNPFLTADEGGNAPLVLLDEVNVEDYTVEAVNNEEPREYFIILNTNQEGIDASNESGGFTQDKFKQYEDTDKEYDDWTIKTSGDNSVSPYLRVFAETMPNYNNSLSPNAGDMLSVWDYFHLGDEKPTLGLVIDIVPYDEDDHRLPQDTLGKITDYQETMFNRIHRLEQLDVMDRDYYDWDDFSEVRQLPRFSDTGLELMRMSNYYTEDLGGIENYYSVDDEVNTTPWWFYDTFKMSRQVVL